MRGDRESIDAIPVPKQRLELVQMKPHAILGARHLGGIGSSPHECRDDDRVTRGRVRRARQHQAIAKLHARVDRETLIDRRGSR